MPVRPDATDGLAPERPLPTTYWLVAGRLLVGEYPGSQSRADAMERLRRFLQAGVTCFVDLTEPNELPSYESLLPFATPDGRRVEYLREPIPDHGLPDSAESMERILATLDDALAAGHCVYLHCRAGIGRSSTVAGCWLASRRGGEAALEELQQRWQSSAKSRAWPLVPETEEQVEYVRAWRAHAAVRVAVRPARDLVDRARGALLGLAAGDAAGSARESAGLAPGQWTQHTALALCLAESLVECGRADAKDQIERYRLWQREGHLAAVAGPSNATPDVARALANYLWRGQATAGSHDPRDRSTAALPRVVSAVLHALPDVDAAVQLSGESARTTHQSPFVIDACRYYGALLVGAFRGEGAATVLRGLYEPAPGAWASRPLKPAIVAMAKAGVAASVEPAAGAHDHKAPAPDVVHALARVRTAVAEATDFGDALRRACDAALEPGLEAALAGTLMGALHGAAVIPHEVADSLMRRDLLESFADRLAARPGRRQA